MARRDGKTDEIKGDEHTIAQESVASAHKDAAGNFVIGSFFGDVRCRYGHETRLFNIGRGHFVACDTCRTYIHVGSNLMSSWRQEDDRVWQRNRESVEGYEFVE
jgi:hypothetical protein